MKNLILFLTSFLSLTFAQANDPQCQVIWEKQNKNVVAQYVDNYQNQVRIAIKDAYLASGFLIRNSDIDFDIHVTTSDLINDGLVNFYRNIISMSAITVNYKGTLTQFNINPVVHQYADQGQLVLISDATWDDDYNAIGDVIQQTCELWTSHFVETDSNRIGIDKYEITRASKPFTVATLPSFDEKHNSEIVKLP